MCSISQTVIKISLTDSIIPLFGINIIMTGSKTLVGFILCKHLHEFLISNYRIHVIISVVSLIPIRSFFAWIVEQEMDDF